ncbi:hypothetical protein B0T26DRAFT_59619 [Lasiosphaeria miniovina]|uniref:Uncharacterized protein n=1 Tax=Lasiosphaeria miniovina TaxID=1954250 RepID=A0AA40EG85_9PEZI|nr:uncharacterized protein B0T26DRAFT_59619 [Lasiosphaeria miniovina]KAK0734193.1 hypothetical protein B0T26DRAFT_59619 [Lasiosphaeria miniovina]
MVRKSSGCFLVLLRDTLTSRLGSQFIGWCVCVCTSKKDGGRKQLLPAQSQWRRRGQFVSLGGAGGDQRNQRAVPHACRCKNRIVFFCLNPSLHTVRPSVRPSLPAGPSRKRNTESGSCLRCE